MKKVTMSPPTLGFVVATRAALALGVGMLVAKRIPERRRKALARTLIGIGVASTVPAVMAVKRQNRRFIAT
ncbi:MAG TPA: hypothetical protein VJN70_10440 [Gemmatimonadaceae bacterium]|nr:hypothetical protein [Gemmatimonadaceae bacterium]